MNARDWAIQSRGAATRLWHFKMSVHTQACMQMTGTCDICRLHANARSKCKQNARGFRVWGLKQQMSAECTWL